MSAPGPPRSASGPPPLAPGRAWFFGFARDGLACAARALAPAGATWLVPRWVCAVVPHAIAAGGGAVAYYDIDPATLSPDMAAVEAGLAAGARGVLIVHFFGLPGPAAAALAAARRHGAALVEDCAIAAFSRGPGGAWLGTVGDAAVFSFRKSLPLRSGAALLASEGAAERCAAALPPALRRAPRLRPWLRARARRLAMRLGPPALRRRAILASIAAEPSAIASVPEAIDEGARRALTALDPLAWGAARRTRCEAIARFVRARGLDTPLPERLPEGTVPFAVPVRAPAARALAERLRLANVPCGVWPEPAPERAPPPVLLLRPGDGAVPLEAILDRLARALPP